MSAVAHQYDYQCHICFKTFTTLKGLTQHAVIHTGEKPFQCDVCSQKFRFKSNLFEHMSVHNGATPYACPYCGKACRLKGNLKKHLRTHVTSKEELEAAWKPFAKIDKTPDANRRRSQKIVNRLPLIDVSDDGTNYLPKIFLPKKSNTGIGELSDWIQRIENGSLIPQVDLDYKLHRLESSIYHNQTLISWTDLIEVAKPIPLEPYNCPKCQFQFMTKSDCVNHYNIEHQKCPEYNFYCEKCFRGFSNHSSYNQHMQYHDRTKVFIKSKEDEVSHEIDMVGKLKT
ncbi:hypothetical protein GCK72_004002 [Caenorhabditis remanei]|uniref:C2H2-type domain-containing protein n=1 Tax=Caenorhabditis remanei TaxID=31234 RepID=A0A6A5HB26_CAERE|nr:hypothetical protein GCK72_004002 [Caenorhabditis remanei]KAF1764056.1 hypothetical protein GCK72_004002 [Caenorhabditis remanei]